MLRNDLITKFYETTGHKAEEIKNITLRNGRQIAIKFKDGAKGSFTYRTPTNWRFVYESPSSEQVAVGVIHNYGGKNNES